MTAEFFDLVVIGTGEGGAAAATKCRKAGWTVAIVDAEPFGGTCALRGCDPKKVLIGGAEVVAWHRRMQTSGVAGDAAIDWPSLMRFKETFTEPVPNSVEGRFAKLGIEAIHGEATFVETDKIKVGEREIVAKHFVIASGASPRPLGVPGEELVTSSTQFLELTDIPARIAFIGAGYVSLEFAHLATQAGVQTSIFGRGNPLRGFDEDVVRRLLEHSTASGIRIHLDVSVIGVEQAQSGLRIHTGDVDGPAGEFDLIVHGAGRVPNTARLKLDAGGVKTDEQGAITVNEFLQSVSNPKVYAAGDVTLPDGKLPLTPVAAHEGMVVASNLLHGNTRKPDYRGTPSVVFTLPPLASAGLTEKLARESGTGVRVKTGDTAGWYSNRRTRQPTGMFKTIVDESSDQLLGAHLLGSGADEVINIIGMAMRSGITATQLRHMIYAYPTSGSDLPYMV